MMGSLRAIVYALIFGVLYTAEITVKDWQYWAVFVLLIAQACTFIFEN